jgi:hypothetical protein
MMKISRRKFLTYTAYAISIPILNMIKISSQLSSKGSRGLLFDKDEIERLRETVKHPRFSAYWDSLLNADLRSDRRFLLRELNLKNHVRHLLKARRILERTSFVYILTEDKKYLDIARLAIDRILEYRRWDYFLEGGEHTIGLQRAPETTIAMSFVREWLEDTLDRETMREIEKQIAEKGAMACYRTLYGMKYPDRVTGWGFDPETEFKYKSLFDLRRWPIILNSTNLKALPIAGLGVAGCLLHGKHPQAKQWIDMALQSAREFATVYGSDGSYDEGITYWGYTTTHICLFIEVIHRKLNIDESRLINFPGTARFALQMFMPTRDEPNDVVNFGDASRYIDISSAAWIARTYRDPIAQYLTMHFGSLRTYYAIIWYDPTVPEREPGIGLYNVRFANDWIISRTGWDEGSSLLAFRSGPPANHEHADRNSIIFKAYGERLLNDPFGAAYAYIEPHWLLRKTEAHTTILINGEGHQYHDGKEGTNASMSRAYVVNYRSTDKYLIVTSDATQAYKLGGHNVELVSRTVIFIKPDIILLLDRVRFKLGQGDVQLRFQVYNKDKKGQVEIIDDGFIIKRPGASLKCSAISKNMLTFKTGFLEIPEDIGIFPYAEISSRNSSEHIILTACTAQKRGKRHGDFKFEIDGNAWRIKGVHNDLSFSILIDTITDIPTIKIPWIR